DDERRQRAHLAMMREYRVEIDVDDNLAVDQNERLPGKKGRGRAHAAAGAEDFGLLARIDHRVAELVFDQLAEMVRVDDDVANAVAAQKSQRPAHERDVTDGQKRLGTLYRQVAEPRAEPGGKYHSFHSVGRSI